MTAPKVHRHFSTSILLWMRDDLPREAGMNRWKGPHSKIISATPGLKEYRQLHLAETNMGIWPPASGLETDIPAERKIDGVAEVTFNSVFSVLQGREQTQLAHKDEINVFRRTLLYLGLPYSSRWYDVARPDETVGSRVLVYLRRRDGVGARAFRTFINDRLAPALAGTGVLKELRTQTFLPWNKKLWDSPNVAHDNPADQRFHASVILGFSNSDAQAAFLDSGQLRTLSSRLAPHASAAHAYRVSGALTFVKNGVALPHARE